MTFTLRYLPSLRIAGPSARSRGAAFGLAILLVCQVAPAADKPLKAPPVPSANSILTQNQLRECVVQKERLRVQTDSVLKSKSQVDVDKAEIDRTGAAIAVLGSTLDRTSAEAVDTYNARVGERNVLVDAYQAKVAAYNKEAEDAIATRESYDKTCSNRRYDDRDLKDIERKK